MDAEHAHSQPPAATPSCSFPCWEDVIEVIVARVPGVVERTEPALQLVLSS